MVHAAGVAAFRRALRPDCLRVALRTDWTDTECLRFAAKDVKGFQVEYRNATTGQSYSLALVAARRRDVDRIVRALIAEKTRRRG